MMIMELSIAAIPAKDSNCLNEYFCINKMSPSMGTFNIMVNIYSLLWSLAKRWSEVTGTGGQLI